MDHILKRNFCCGVNGRLEVSLSRTFYFLGIAIFVHIKGTPLATKGGINMLLEELLPDLRGDVHMTPAKVLDFLIPPPLSLSHSRNLSVPSSAFSCYLPLRTSYVHAP